MKAKVTFIYQKRSDEITCKDEDEFSLILRKFINKLNQESTIFDYDFFYDGQKLKIDKNLKNLKNPIFRNKRDISISVEKKSRVIRCPKCICNDCIINIDDYIITFYGCKYGHITHTLFNKYNESQNVDLSQIVCSYNACFENQAKNPKDFYKCLTCTKLLKDTKYFCNKHTMEHDKSHEKVKYDLKNYFCEKYFHQFLKYCFNCKKNLCEECLDEHIMHSTKSYEAMSPNIKKFNETLNTIRKKIDILRIIIDDIKTSLDGTLKLYEKYCDMVADIVEKYTLYNNKYKNYRIVKSFFNLNKSNNKIIEDLDRIINGKNRKEKSNFLIEIYEKDRENYKKININKIENYQEVEDDLSEWDKWEKDNMSEKDEEIKIEISHFKKNNKKVKK